ncbi:MAG: heat-shock protein Hsp20 [Deltaproteobacteria bacterium]|jgi:HSP20 family protein|nr:heat-shock protein Hsp20 [Deltaproteobacteria bacterium]
MPTLAVPTLFDRLIQDDGASLRGRSAGQAFTPALDLFEYSDRYEVAVDLPGVDQSKVDVAFKEGTLTIRGERAARAPEDGRLLRSERSAGRFGRSVVFREEVAVDEIGASFRDGVLTVTVPKTERRKPRQIPVAVH